jgi:hypothetical protein
MNLHEKMNEDIKQLENDIAILDIVIEEHPKARLQNFRQEKQDLLDLRRNDLALLDEMLTGM